MHALSKSVEAFYRPFNQTCKPINQMGDIINNLVEDIKKYEIDLLFHFPLLLTDFKK